MITSNDLKIIEPYLKNAINLDIKEYPNNEKEAVIELKDGSKYSKSLTKNIPIQRITGISSIVEHFSRGCYGNSAYRGNCSGLLIRDLYEYFRPNKILDPMCGSNTSGEVSKEMKLNQISLDLNPKFGGFNILKDDFDQSFDLIFCHFPYFVFKGSKMPVYSGVMWGKPNPYDLSRINDMKKFTYAINIAEAKMYQALKKNGHLIMLVGDSRFHGAYYSMFKNMDFYGQVENIIIKKQFNYRSLSIKYRTNFIPIEHEYIVVLRKNDEYIIKCIHISCFEKNILKSSKITWRALIRSVIEHFGGRISKEQLYIELKNHPKSQNNNFLKEKIRQVINTYKSEFKILENSMVMTI